MKRVRSTGLVLIMAGLLSTSGPTWAAGSSTNRSPARPGISAGLAAVLDLFGGLWGAVMVGAESLLGDGTTASMEKEETGVPPPEETSGTGGPWIPGGGCIDPNGQPVYVVPCPY